MRRFLFLTLLVYGLLFLSACGGSSKEEIAALETQTAQAMATQVAQAVAATQTANAPTPTNTPASTLTPTQTPSPVPSATPMPQPPLATPTLVPTSTPTVGRITVTVPASVVWFDTGIEVQSGQSLIFSASGSPNLWGGTPEATVPGPNGWFDSSCPSAENRVDCLMNQVAYGKLVGKIGNNEPFEVGANLETSASASGILYLGANDNVCCYHDNSGDYQVTIMLYSLRKRICILP